VVRHDVLALPTGLTIAAISSSGAAGRGAAARRSSRTLRIPGAAAAPGHGPLPDPPFPATPIVFILVTIALIVSDLATQPVAAMAGRACRGLGFPIYYVWKGRGAADR